jgi:D-alanyl-D-alanine dipeptidase
MISCQADKRESSQISDNKIGYIDTSRLAPSHPNVDSMIKQKHIDYDTTVWTEILAGESTVLDLKYATSDNFTKQKIYGCGRCFLRHHVAEAFLNFQAQLKQDHNLGIILYDCYRPVQYQQKLWDIIPDWRYVTPPDKGSMHNRGMAIDVGIIDSIGQVLDMGTAFDHFGNASHHNANNISQEAKDNRILLKSELDKYGFKAITSEWWHYSYREDIKPLDDWIWACE